MEENKSVNMSDEKVRQIVFEAINQTQEKVKTGDFDILAFARGLSSGMGMYVTPQMVNSNLKSINLNPSTSTYENIATALESPKTNEDLIISYCQDQYMSNTLFKRNFDYFAKLLAFNLSIQCINADDEYDSKAYKRDFGIVEKFLNKFDYRTEFKKAVFNMLNADIYPAMFRTDMDENKWVLQDFPYSNTLITGRFSHGILCDYDLSFLMSGTQDILMYPKWIKKKFDKLFQGNGKYIPSNGINHRTGKFAYYIQTSPKEEKNEYGFYDGAWVFKFNPDFIAEIPYFAPMALDTALSTPYRSLQYNQAIASARKIITSEWPTFTDSKSGNQTNALAIQPTLMGQLIGACMGGLNANGDLFNLVALPSTKIDVHQLENKNSSMYADYLKNVSGLLGGANTLFSIQKQTATESLISADLDKMLMQSIYSQFNSFLNYYVNMATKKYKFDFKFSGTNLYLDREARMKEASDFAKIGIVGINKIANAIDMDVFELKREMDMTKSMKFSEMLTPLLNVYTDSKDSGRPKSSNSELSESNQITRDAGSNVSK